MKKIILLIFIFGTMGCATKKQNKFVNLDCSKYPVLDSLTYIEFPNEYDYYIEGVGVIQRKGNSIFEEIKSFDEAIIPCLIEKIKDSTRTNIRYADSYNYTHSDIALFLLKYKNTNKNIEDILYQEFKKDFLKSNLYPFEQKIMIVFFNNDKKINYNNRLRLYKRMKKWYLKECKK